jgi:predicted nucleotidyltransferase
MTEKIEKIKVKILPILKKNDVVRASIFGSLAGGEEKKGSGIEDLLEMKVDLLTYGGINHRLKEYIYKDEIKIYGKRS